MSKNHLSQQQNWHHNRKIHYIDHQLQKQLVIALVVLEVTLLSIAGFILYVRLNAIVDENLYRIHFSGQPAMFSVLLKESLQIMGGLAAVNLIALLMADRIWSRHVNGIMKSLRDLLSRTRNLDLRPDNEVQDQHPVLAMTLAWRDMERTRNKVMRKLVAQAEGIVNTQPIEAGELHQCLISLSEQLPSSSELKSSQANLTEQAHSNASL